MSSAKITKIIKENKRFLIATHVNPDADALSSQLAMALYLKHLGKKVYVINADAAPARFHFIPEIHLVEKLKDDIHLEYDVAVILDCGDIDRIDQVKRLIQNDTMIINIDHHLTNTQFGDANLVNHKACSTAEVLFLLFQQFKFRLTREIAILLYLGIMTDTGSFRYDSTTAYTHYVVSELMKFKFSISDLYRKMYEHVPLEDLKLFTRIVNRFERLYGGRVVCIEMKKRVIEKFSSEFDVKDKIFSFLRAIKGVEVIIILTENARHVTRVNLRSQGEKVNVAEIAASFNGGGHRKASGCVIHEDFAKAKVKILSALEKVL